VETVNGKPFLWRGMLGGLIGGVLAVAILYSYQYGDIKYAIFYQSLMAMIYVLPITIIGGTAIGAIISMLCKRLRTTRITGILVGAITATILGAIIGAALHYLMTDQTPVALWGSFFVRCGMIVGLITGIVSGAQDHTLRRSAPLSTIP
jgi:uncharacterized membrane protein YhaH (DUF805 family)